MSDLVYGIEDVQVCAQTALGEARSEGEGGMSAVLHVIVNRCRDRRWPNTPAKVARQRKQFSCWNQADWNLANLHRMIHADFSDPLYRQAFYLAAKILAGLDSDITYGANHYQVTGTNAYWARGKQSVVSVGKHQFYIL